MVESSVGQHICRPKRSFDDSDGPMLHRQSGEVMEWAVFGPRGKGDVLNSHRAASPLVRMVNEEDRWEALDQLQGIFLQNWMDLS
ncbi:hypothetical protein TNCV_4246891 [Trichonephila clavipes]|nr:hypothetical protein TNCV_4246891 [Trichonephila clavipes]